MIDEPHRYSAEDLDKLKSRIHIVQAIHDALQRWPEVSALAREADSDTSFTAGVRALLNIDEIQAEAVSDIQVRRLNREQRGRIGKELDEMKADLARGQGQLAD